MRDRLNLFLMATASTVADLAIGLAVLALLGVLYYVLFYPLNRVRDLCDIGYEKRDRYGRNKRQLAREVQRLKKVGELPPVYPNGWFALCESDELKRGQSRPVHALGEHLVVFRTEEGQACVLNAYCPHLGAHLGVGGRVAGNCIECPFHGWKFDGRDGQCTSIPYTAGKVPQVARVKSWPVDEVNGFIFFWYHAEQEEPSWRIPVIDELQPSEANSRNKTGSWLFRGRSDYKVNAHIQEIPENGADVAHLAHLHGPSLLLGSSLQTVSHKCQESDRFSVVENGSAPLLRHHWWVKWTSPELDDEESRHMAVAKLRQHFRLFGRFSFFHTVVEAQQIGPGLVHLFIETGVGKCVFIQTVTPVEPLVQRVVHRLYSEPRFITPAAKLLLWGESVMFERDVSVWNHKTYIGNPLLVSEDQTILKHRRWYKQFYSENSPRFESLRKSASNSIIDW